MVFWGRVLLAFQNLASKTKEVTLPSTLYLPPPVFSAIKLQLLVVKGTCHPWKKMFSVAKKNSLTLHPFHYSAN